MNEVLQHHQMDGRMTSSVWNGSKGDSYHRPPLAIHWANQFYLFMMATDPTKQIDCASWHYNTTSIYSACLHILLIDYNPLMSVCLVHFSVLGQIDVMKWWRSFSERCVRRILLKSTGPCVKKNLRRIQFCTGAR